jgi:hypothetical protein
MVERLNPKISRCPPSLLTRFSTLNVLHFAVAVYHHGNFMLDTHLTFDVLVLPDQIDNKNNIVAAKGWKAMHLAVEIHS